MTSRPWVPHRPEQRFSVVVDHFLTHALIPPFYATAIHDADEGTRTDRQRARDKERGQKPGQLDWDVCQGPGGLWRKLELKRGKNDLSDNQRMTVSELTACGAKPVVAWNLRQAHDGLAAQGFRFKANVETLLQKYEAQLEALDRTAELTLAGAAPKKPARKTRNRPRNPAGKAMVRRAAAKGILV